MCTHKSLWLAGRQKSYFLWCISLVSLPVLQAIQRKKMVPRNFSFLKIFRLIYGIITSMESFNRLIANTRPLILFFFNKKSSNDFSSLSKMILYIEFYRS